MSANILENIDPFKFAAASYLCWWIRVDRDYFEWNDLTEEKLNTFLTRYKVRRTITGEDLGPFISLIEQQRGTSITENVVPELIAEACGNIEAKYNREKTCLSAVSKVLWMVHGHPIAIYDKLARDGLKQRVGKKLTGYEFYHQYWLREFHAAEAKIQAAQSWLPNSILVGRLKRYGVATEDELRSWVRQPWFANRIFDRFLVNIGNERTKQRNRAVDVACMLDPTEAGI